METSSAKRIVAGGLVALFVALIVAALAVSGVINMTLGHVLMALAFVVGVLIIWTELIPAKPAHHKVAWTVALFVGMMAGDRGIVRLKEGGSLSLSIWGILFAPLQAIGGWWVGPHGRWFDRVLGGAYAVLLLFGAAFVTALAKVIKARKLPTPLASKGFLDYKLQTEKAIAKLPALLDSLNKITNEVNRSVAELSAVFARMGTTAEALKASRRLAKRLDNYSESVRRLHANFEGESRLLEEGLAGWAAWIEKVQPTKIQMAPLADLLRGLKRNTDEAVVYLQEAIDAMSGGKGAFGILDAAIDRHAVARRLILVTFARISNGCGTALAVFDALPTPQ